MARPRFRFGLARAPHEPPTSGGYRGALVRLQARDGYHTSDNEPSLAITAAQAGLAFCSEPSRAKRVPSHASASITGCVRKSLLRLRPSACLTRDHRLGAACRGSEAGEPTGAREQVCGPGVILTASVKGAREGARVKIMPVGCPQTAGRASRSGAGLAIGRRGEVGGGAKVRANGYGVFAEAP